MKALSFKLYESVQDNPTVEELNTLLDSGLIDLSEYSELMGIFHKANGEALTFHFTDSDLFFIGKFDAKPHRYPFSNVGIGLYTRTTIIRTFAHKMGYLYMYDPSTKFLFQVDNGRIVKIEHAEAVEKYGARPTRLRRK